MALNQKDIAGITSLYKLGSVKQFKFLSAGAVQESIFIETAKGAFVLKYYLNRSTRYVQFETALIHYLSGNGFPCPKVYPNAEGALTGNWKGKPYALYEFIEGEHAEALSLQQKEKVIQSLARLHLLTASFRTPFLKDRWNYSPAFCQNQAVAITRTVDSTNARKKLEWLTMELKHLQLPDSLPCGICHGDLHPSNLLFERGAFKALIDFDDANGTYYLWDIVNFIDYHCKKTKEQPDFPLARRIIAAYTAIRPLSEAEKMHCFDVYKLQVLIDCLWFFERGTYPHFFEKERIDYFNKLGREEFYSKLVG